MQVNQPIELEEPHFNIKEIIADDHERIISEGNSPENSFDQDTSGISIEPARPDSEREYRQDCSTSWDRETETNSESCSQGSEPENLGENRHPRKEDGEVRSSQGTTELEGTQPKTFGQEVPYKCQYCQKKYLYTGLLPCPKNCPPCQKQIDKDAKEAANKPKTFKTLQALKNSEFRTKEIDQLGFIKWKQ